MTTSRRPHACFLGATALLSGLAGLSAPALAQPAAGEQAVALEEIVVTARRVEESLQDTPVSVSAISTEGLTQRSIPNVVDLAKSLPNITATNGPQSSTDANFFVRGVGQFDFIITNDPGVGVYLDGVYLGRTIGAQLDSFDVARIEVLRGPQGTLFGRNTIGGAVNIVTKRPDPGGFEGQARATFGTDNLWAVEAAVNVPVNDFIAFRLSGLKRKQDGFAERAGDEATYGTVDTEAARFSIESTPTDALTLTLAADYTRNDGSQLPTRSAGAIPGFPLFIGAIPADINNDVSTDRDVVFSSADPVNDQKSWGVGLTVQYDIGDTTLKSITAYRGLDAFSKMDSDATLYKIYDQDSAADQEQFSQEFQVLGKAFDGQLDYIAGLYTFDETADQQQALCIAGTGVRRDTRCGFWFQDNAQDTQSYAGFGQATWNFTEQWGLTLGGRYTYEEKEVETTQFYDMTALVPGLVVPIITDGTLKDDWSEFSPKVGIQFQPDRDQLYYASYAKGFRSGGFNGRLAVPGAPIRTYDPDTNDTFELGSKLDLLDRRLRVNLSGFYSIYKDIQLTVTDPIVAFFVANAAEAELYGFEAEVTAAVAKGLTLNLGLGYTHSEITEADPALAPARITEGNVLPFTPEWTLSLGAQYDIPLPNEATVTLRGDYVFQDDIYFSPANQPREKQDAYGLANFRVTYTEPGGRYDIAGFVRNAFDKDYDTFGQDATFNQGVSYRMQGRPREWGVQVTVNF